MTPAPAHFLALRPHSAFEGESLDGLLARVAAEEGIATTFEITREAGVDWPHRPRLSRRNGNLPAIAASLRVSLPALEERAQDMCDQQTRRWFNGTTLDRDLLVGNVRRFSPASLAKEPYHRALWDLRPFPFCEESMELLLDRCPDPLCRAVQRWLHAGGIARCDHCGADLRQSSPIAIPRKSHDALRAAIGLVHHNPDRRAASLAALPPSLRATPPGELLDLLVAVAVVEDPSLRGRQGRAMLAGADPMAMAEAIASAWRRLERWPDGFLELADQRIAARAGRFGDGNRGATVAFLELADRTTQSPGLRRAAAEIRLALGGRRDGVDVKAAALYPMLRVSYLVHWRRRGMLPARFAFEDGLPVALVSEAAARELSSWLASTFSMEDASVPLGSPVHAVEQMVATGVLDLADRPSLSATDHGERVARSEIGRLERRLEAFARPVIHGMPLPEAMRSIGGAQKPYGPLLQAMVEGRLPFGMRAGPAPLLNRILIAEVDLNEIGRMRFDRSDHPRIRFAKEMTKGDACVLLNLPLKYSASVLTRWPSDNSATVPVDEIEAMAATHISHAEISARLRTNPAQTRRLIERLDMRPVADGLFRRREAERLISFNRHG